MAPHVITDPFPPVNQKFTLNVSGIAGFFGGEEAFSAMSSVHMVPLRRWFGWYNSPGSYFVAKKYGMLPTSPFWDGLFPGRQVTPSQLVELDTEIDVGWRFTGLFSGTKLPITGHLSFLFTSYCMKLPAQNYCGDAEDNREDGESRDIPITIAKVPKFKDWPESPRVPEYMFPTFTPMAISAMIATILFSVASSVLAGLYGDWYSFSLILLGVFSNGISCMVFGSGQLYLKVANPSKTSPDGDGILFDKGNIVIVKGDERSVSGLIHSRFSLYDDPTKPPSPEKYNQIGYSCGLLLVQFLFQLFLIPQGHLIGQIFFIATLIVSWMCNGYFASLDKERLQQHLLFKLIGQPEFYQIKLPKWSTAVAFSIFYSKPSSPRSILNELLGNDTPAWDLWKEAICAACALDEAPSKILDSNRAPPDLIVAFSRLSVDDQDFVKEFLRLADKGFDCANHVNSGSIKFSRPQIHLQGMVKQKTAEGGSKGTAWSGWIQGWNRWYRYLRWGTTTAPVIEMHENTNNHV